ncbi:hypothetical protein LCGC14_0396730 [marine sediment metagenome]|uniref:Uncharacterized protein n=1 Tax=marine sediment metagenome TaxID=412755 RepID=A0A0F9VK51_9ZZZZ
MSFPVTTYGSHKQIRQDCGTNKRGRMLGTRMELPDGRVFRWMKSSAALTIGRVCGYVAQSAGLAKDGLPSGSAARTTAQWDAGTYTVIVATTASASTGLHIFPNRFDDGILWINDQAGGGQMFQVKSHGVSTSSGTTAVTITMYDEEILDIALTTASQWGLMENLYSRVVIHTGTTGGGPAVGVAPVAVDSGDYFWGQTWGPAVVMQGATAALDGDKVVVINTTGGSTGVTGVAGSVYGANTTKFTEGWKESIKAPTVGYTLTAGGASEFTLVFLTIAP